MNDDRDAVPLDDVLASLPAERQARIRARSAELRLSVMVPAERTERLTDRVDQAPAPPPPDKRTPD